MQNKKISIITVCYNEPELEATCKSIINQTFQDFEWIVVDGGSNQKTLDIFDKYKNRIDKFISEKDTGIYNAMNKGIKMAVGEYLLFLNAGDYLYENETLQKYIDAGLDCDLIYGKLFAAGKEKSYIKEYPKKIDSTFFIFDSLPHPATLIKSDLFKKYGLYNENNKIVSDYEKWVEFVIQHNCSYKYVDIIGAAYNLNGISSNEKYDEMRRCEIKKVIEKFFTEKQIKQAFQHNKKKYKLLENIFSLTNRKGHIETQKIVRILWMDFIISSKKLC